MSKRRSLYREKYHIEEHVVEKQAVFYKMAISISISNVAVKVCRVCRNWEGANEREQYQNALPRSFTFGCL